MLYREESQYLKVKNDTGSTPPPHREEFVECLRNALKIMETKYTQIQEKE